MYFDNDEDYDVNGSYVKVDFNWFFFYEFGYSLGLDYFWNLEFVMFLFYFGYIFGLIFYKDDVEGI